MKVPRALWLPLLWVLAAPVAAEPLPSRLAALPPGTRLAGLGAALETAPSYLRADFAWCAVYEMALAYADEAERARNERRARGRKPGLRRWAGEVESYARHLAAIADGLDGTSRVALTVGPGGLVQLQLESGPLVVTGPRIGEPAAFEARILDRFCALHPCDTLLAMFQPLPDRPRPPPEARPEGPPRAPVEWSFAGHSGPLCRTGDGLELQFNSRNGLERKRRFCGRLAGELEALVAALTGLAERGTSTDWESLAVLPEIAGGRDRVRVNRAGDVLRLRLPLLAGSPGLLRQVRDWLRERVRGGSPRLLLRDAERLLPGSGR